MIGCVYYSSARPTGIGFISYFSVSHYSAVPMLTLRTHLLAELDLDAHRSHVFVIGEQLHQDIGEFLTNTVTN